MRQEAEKRCKLLFVWITAKKLPGLQASRGYAISLKIFFAYSEILSVDLLLCLLGYWFVYHEKEQQQMLRSWQ